MPLFSVYLQLDQQNLALFSQSCVGIENIWFGLAQNSFSCLYHSLFHFIAPRHFTSFGIRLLKFDGLNPNSGDFFFDLNPNGFSKSTS